MNPPPWGVSGGFRISKNVSNDFQWFSHHPAGLGWAGLGCAGLGLGCAGLGWAVLGWAGLGWAVLGWDPFRKTSRNQFRIPL